MNAYIEDCYHAWVKVNQWFLRIIATEALKAFKEAVEVCRNE